MIRKDESMCDNPGSSFPSGLERIRDNQFWCVNICEITDHGHAKNGNNHSKVRQEVSYCAGQVAGVPKVFQGGADQKGENK